MQDGAALRRLLAFLRPGASTLLYEHLASVVCNVSRLRAGRAMLVQPETAGLQLVADLLSSESEVKRSGGAAACKHICVHARAEGTLETVLEGTGSLRTLLVSPPLVLSYVTIMRTALPSASSATRRWCSYPEYLDAMWPHFDLQLDRKLDRQWVSDFETCTQCARWSGCYLQAVIDGLEPKETIAQVREDVALAVAALAREDAGRDCLLKLGARESVQQGYEYEEHAGTMGAMEAIGRAFLGLGDEADDDSVHGTVVVGT
jgi:hypothetical protein